MGALQLFPDSVPPATLKFLSYIASRGEAPKQQEVERGERVLKITLGSQLQEQPWDTERQDFPAVAGGSVLARS